MLCIIFHPQWLMPPQHHSTCWPGGSYHLWCSWHQLNNSKITMSYFFMLFRCYLEFSWNISFFATKYFIALFIKLPGTFNRYFILYPRIFHCAFHMIPWCFFYIFHSLLQDISLYFSYSICGIQLFKLDCRIMKRDLRCHHWWLCISW